MHPLVTPGAIDAPAEWREDADVRWNWLKTMYVANVLISGPIGLGTLVAPEFVRGLFGIPAGDPVSFGIATGAVPLAFGIAGVAGLWAPLRLSPVLGLQVVYKSLFLLGVLVPLALMDGIPEYALPIVGIFVFFVVGNLVAIPWDYLRSGLASPGSADAV